MKSGKPWLHPGRPASVKINPLEATEATILGLANPLDYDPRAIAAFARLVRWLTRLLV
jgi:hypothetical protein